MSFSETQKEQIRQYLGFEAEAEEDSAALIALRADLESKMDEVGASAVKQTTVEYILTQIVAVEAAIATVGTSAGAMGSLKKADEAEFYELRGGGTGQPLTNVEYGELLLSRLAARFGFAVSELPSDYFGASGVVAAGVASYPRRDCPW
jgi:hypothetical protein